MTIASCGERERERYIERDRERERNLFSIRQS